MTRGPSLLVLLLAALVAACAGSKKPPPYYGPANWSPPPPPPPTSPTAATTGGERIELLEGVPRVTASGLSLTNTRSSFSGGEPPEPGISTPAIAITRIAVTASFAGKTTELWFTKPSPGVASLTNHSWEGFEITLVDQRYVAGKPVTEFVVRRP
jgi:hypothetical protein